MTTEADVTDLVYCPQPVGVDSQSELATVIEKFIVDDIVWYRLLTPKEEFYYCGALRKYES